MSILASSPLSTVNNEEISTLSPTFSTLLAPLEAHLPHLTPLVSGSNRPLDFTFAHQVRALVYYHTEAFTSGQDLLQAVDNDPLARALMVPESGLGESTFYEANADRGSLQMFELLDRLTQQVSKRLKIAYPELGKLVAIDGSLIEACLSMRWAEYSSTQRKAKAHLGFDLNYGIPRCLKMTDARARNGPLFLPSSTKERPAFWIGAMSTTSVLTPGSTKANTSSPASEKTPSEKSSNPFPSPRRRRSFSSPKSDSETTPTAWNTPSF